MLLTYGQEVGVAWWNLALVALCFGIKAPLFMPRLTWSDPRPQPAAKLFFPITGYESFIDEI